MSGIDQLGDLHATLDPLDHEALRTLLDAYETADPADTPIERQRSAAQRRYDAFSAMLRTLLACDSPKLIEGYRAQIVAVVDVLSLFGLDTLDDLTQITDAQLAAIASMADVDTDTARQIAAAAIDRAHPDDDAGCDTDAACDREAVTGTDADGDMEASTGADETDAAVGVGESGDGVTGEVAGTAVHADAAPDTAEAAAAPASARSHVRDLPGLGQPQRTSWLRYTGPTSPATIRRLADHAKIQILATMGPWRAVTVGQTMRSLPPWLRTALLALHRHCRGPDCDRPTSWADAHHTIPWDDGGDTAVNTNVPLCRGHHTPVTIGDWTVTLDCETGICTWTGPDHQTIHTRPPPL